MGGVDAVEPDAVGLAAIGLIIGALQVTGMAGTLTNDLVYLAGDSVLILLVMGALTSFVLGIGHGTLSALALALVVLGALIALGQRKCAGEALRFKL